MHVLQQKFEVVVFAPPPSLVRRVDQKNCLRPQLSRKVSASDAKGHGLDSRGCFVRLPIHGRFSLTHNASGVEKKERRRKSRNNSSLSRNKISLVLDGQGVTRCSHCCTNTVVTYPHYAPHYQCLFIPSIAISGYDIDCVVVTH